MDANANGQQTVLKTSNESEAHKRKPWTKQQEQALVAAIKKYGEGRWAVMLSDLELSHEFRGKTGMQLKDKWRNMKQKMLRESSQGNDANAIPFARGGGISKSVQQEMMTSLVASRSRSTKDKKVPASISSEEGLVTEQKQANDEKKMKNSLYSSGKEQRTISIEFFREEDETSCLSGTGDGQDSPVIEDVGGGIFLKFEKKIPRDAGDKKKQRKTRKRMKAVLPIQFAKLPRIEQELNNLVSDLAECATVLPLQKLHKNCQQVHKLLQETLKDVHIPQTEADLSVGQQEQGRKDEDYQHGDEVNQVNLRESTGFELEAHRRIEDSAKPSTDITNGVGESSTESQHQLRSKTSAPVVAAQPGPRTRTQKKTAFVAEARNQGYVSKKIRRGKRERRRSY